MIKEKLGVVSDDEESEDEDVMDKIFYVMISDI